MKKTLIDQVVKRLHGVQVDVRDSYAIYVGRCPVCRSYILFCELGTRCFICETSLELKQVLNLAQGNRLRRISTDYVEALRSELGKSRAVVHSESHPEEMPSIQELENTVIG